jgi:predicted nucleotidyltransferase
MSELTNPSPLERVIEILRRHGVEFIVIGGQAESIFGSPRVTYDTDLCYRHAAENLRRLAAALKEIGPTLRGAPADLPFTPDEKTLANGRNWTFQTRLGDLDLLADVEPIGTYEDLIQHAETWRAGDADLKVIALEDLIKVKQHVKRPKDSESLYQLLAIKRLREESGGASR